MSKELEKVLQKIENGRSYRNIMKIEVRAKEDGEEDFIVEGYATIFNEPYELYRIGEYTVSEQVDARSFDECDMSDVIMQYDHQGRVFARNKNNTLTVMPDEKGLKIRANLGGTQLGRQLYEEIKGGYTDKMSFGFTIEEDSLDCTNEEETEFLRTIKKIGKLYDVSAVSLPANDATEISARNFGEGVIKEVEAERQKRASLEKARMECLALLSL